MNKYIDDALIKLRRKYSKDEYVAHLLKQISDLEAEKEKNTSYIQEFEGLMVTSMKNGGEHWFKKYSEMKAKYYELKESIDIPRNYEALSKDYLELKEKYDTLKESTKLPKDYETLLEKYNTLKNKLQWYLQQKH